MNLLTFSLPTESTVDMQPLQRVDLSYGESVYPCEVVSLIRGRFRTEITLRLLSESELLGTFSGPRHSLNIPEQIRDAMNWTAR